MDLALIALVLVLFSFPTATYYWLWMDNETEDLIIPASDLKLMKSFPLFLTAALFSGFTLSLAVMNGEFITNIIQRLTNERVVRHFIPGLLAVLRQCTMHFLDPENLAAVLLISSSTIYITAFIAFFTPRNELISILEEIAKELASAAAEVIFWWRNTIAALCLIMSYGFVFYLLQSDRADYWRSLGRRRRQKRLVITNRRV